MSDLVLALDQGTTSSRAIVFDKTCQIRGLGQQEFEQIFPAPGDVEHDPDAIWTTQLATAQHALAAAECSAADIAAIGITNQRETTVLWDKQTGQPVANAIVWQSRVSAPICDQLKADGHEDNIRQRTGLVVDAYFSGTKIAHLLNTVDGLRARAEAGEILFGTIDTFLLWRLTGGKVHATDYSNASRTMLYNINTLQWDDELLEILNIPRAMLPEVKPSSGLFGETDPELFGTSIPIAGIAGDQQAATFGQACFEPGEAKNTYGTGCFLLMNTGTQPVTSRNGLLTTIGWGINEEVTYCLEGGVFIGGAIVQWLRDGLQMFSSASEVEELATSVDSTDGVYLVPALVGLGAPFWDSDARGTLIGITRGTNRGHIARAALEAIAFQTRDLLDAMQKDSGVELSNLKVDGGATANNFMMQFQSDLLNVKVRRPQIQETTALGAAFLAGLATGVWNDLDDVRNNWALDREFVPAAAAEEMNARYATWLKAVDRSRGWATNV